VRLESVAVELADQIGERLRSAAELAAVVDEQDGKRAWPRHLPMLATALARIGFDGLSITPHGKGHARSQRHAVASLAARGEHELVVFVREPVELDGVEVVSLSPRLTVEWELHGLPAAAKRHRLDAFVTLSERLPLHGQLPIVVWLFESPVRRIRANRASRAPLWHRASDVLTSLLWERSLCRAAHVAFGSQATRDEVLAELALRSTSVVHPGVPPGFSPAGDGKEDYVLHLGSNDPRDNTATAIEVCRRAGARLVVVGGWSGHGAEIRGRVSDAELADLYRRATVFLDPTLYEGFGYGVLEAMASGTPVIASRVTSIPEVVGDAALLYDPSDVDGFASAVRRVMSEPTLSDGMCARGLARAATFTWTKTGAGLSAAITDALP
jgi:glycosyltransferase involved in cell wall biosynthesis